MRMSDWSSDVCSSDLGCRPPPPRRRRQTPPIRASSRRWADRRRTDGACRSARGSRHDRRSRSRDWRAARRRSEEHTSELQSLMRISYAVFCLKKKNNTISILTTIYNESIIDAYTIQKTTTNNNQHLAKAQRE